jgi:hypothetical protein
VPEKRKPSLFLDRFGGFARRNALGALATIALVVGHLAVSVCYFDTAELLDEEAVLPAQARLALTGHLPGRDFTTSSMPLVSVLAGAPMTLLGFSIAAGRLLSALLAGLGIALSAWFVARRTGRPNLGLFTAFLLVASVYWEALVLRCLPDAAASAFVGLALACTVVRAHLLVRAALTGLALGLAISCVPASVLVVPLALPLAFEGSTFRARSLAFFLFVAIPVALLGLQVAVFGHEVMWLNAIELPLATQRGMSIFELLVAVWRYSPAPLLVLLIGAFGVVRLVSIRSIGALSLLMAALAILAFELSTGLGNGNGLSFSLPLIAAAGLVALHETGELVDNPLRYSAFLFPLIAFVYPVPPVVERPEQLRAVYEAAEALRNEQLPQGPILSAIPAVASAAGKTIVAGTQMGKRSIADPGMRSAFSHRQPTVEEIAALISEGKVGAVLLERGDSPANFSSYFPTDRKLRLQQRILIRKAVESSFVLQERFGPLEVYLPRR